MGGQLVSIADFCCWASALPHPFIQTKMATLSDRLALAAPTLFWRPTGTAAAIGFCSSDSVGERDSAAPGGASAYEGHSHRLRVGDRRHAKQ
jgi:hypothetical protein